MLLSFLFLTPPGKNPIFSGDRKHSYSPVKLPFNLKMSLIPSLSLKYPKPFLLFPNSISSSNSNFSILHSKNRYLSFQAIKNVKCLNGGSLNAVACSTSSPLIGRVGLHRREGNFSLLSFGANPRSFYVEDEKADYSQALSALLPFVVALTAVAALSQPSTFTW